MTPAPDREPETLTLSLLAEQLVVTRRRVEHDIVRVKTVTREREQQVDEPLTDERIEVERVPIGRIVEAVPPVREEGDTTVMPVVEEVVVVERRLMLKEEVRIRRVRSTGHHRETVVLRAQEAVVTRVEAGPQPAEASPLPLGPEPTPIEQEHAP